MVSIDLGRRKSARYVRFTINRKDDQPAKYSEIWATGDSYDKFDGNALIPTGGRLDSCAPDRVLHTDQKL